MLSARSRWVLTILFVALLLGYKENAAVDQGRPDHLVLCHPGPHHKPVPGSLTRPPHIGGLPPPMAGF